MIKKKYKSAIFGKTSLNEKQQYNLLDQLNKDDAYILGISRVTLVSLATRNYGKIVLRQVRKRVTEMEKLLKEMNK